VLGPEGSKQLKAFARLGAVGMELAVSTVLGLLGGRWLDQKLSTEPFLTIVGLLLGVAAGFVSLFRAIKSNQQAAESEESSRNPPPRNHE
jgi:F0F1-type ATP synthase assembly protein I